MSCYFSWYVLLNDFNCIVGEVCLDLSHENKIKEIPEDQLCQQLINLYLVCSRYSGDSNID